MTIAPDKGLSSGTFRVFCLNLRFGLADDGPNNWEYRRHAFPHLLSEYPSDFFAFQEANHFQIEYLNGLLPQYGLIGQRSPAPDYWQNNIIFFHRRWQCVHRQHFYLSDTPDRPSKFKDSRWPRQCTMGTFQNIDSRLTVINTHFDFESEVQERSAELILSRLAQLSPSWPVLLVGDFNAGPQSACMQVFTKNPWDFRSAFRPAEHGTHHTFNGVAQCEPIDWILYRGGLQKCGAELVTQQVNGRYPSDHFPLTATFAFVP